MSYGYSKCEILLHLRYNYNLKGKNKLTVEARTRIPIEGTARSKIFKVITEGRAPIWDTRAIAKESGLTTRQVTIARANLRGAGYLPKPTRELSRLTRHTHAATIFPVVKEYREMGLSLREIQLAVKIEKGIDLSYNSVHTATVYGTKTENLRRLSKEENHDIRRDVNMLTLEEISGNVISVLELRKRLSENNLPLPTNRLEWKIAIEKNLYYLLRRLPIPILTHSNTEDINFVDRLISSNLIDKYDVVLFETLKKLYNERQKDFENFPPEIILRMEAFTRAIMQEVQEKNLDLRTEFMQLGLQIGKEWFYDKDSLAVKEQKFIADKIRLGRI